jgi:SAM-dependent methyltransferase
MDGPAKEYLISFYSAQLKLHGDRPEALRWTPEGQRMRYGLLLEVAPRLEGKKLLDYGCGKGDFYSFLKQNRIHADYTGMDINPELIALASMKHPEARFRVFDAEEEDPGEDFDYVFLCGVFNNRVEGATETMKNIMKKLFRHTRAALAVTALSSRAGGRDAELNYVSPAEIVDFALREITPYLVLRHDLVPDDFTLFLYRGPTVKGRRA